MKAYILVLTLFLSGCTTTQGASNNNPEITKFKDFLKEYIAECPGKLITEIKVRGEEKEYSIKCEEVFTEEPIVKSGWSI